MKKIRMALFAALTVSSATVFAYNIKLTNNLDAPVLVNIKRIVCDDINDIKLAKGETKAIDVKGCCLPLNEKAAIEITPQGGKFKGKAVGVVLRKQMSAADYVIGGGFEAAMSCNPFSLNIDSILFSSSVPGRPDLYIYRLTLPK